MTWCDRLKKKQEVQRLEYYRWKYKNPYGTARIALAIENSEILAMNAMFSLLRGANRSSAVICKHVVAKIKIG